MIILAFVLLVLLLTRMVNSYGWGAVIHPGLWFAIAWIFALLSYWAIDAVGGVPVHSPDVLDQLMILLSFTSFAFFSLTFLRAKPIKERGLEISKKIYFLESISLYKFFAITGLIGAIINWIMLGANFGYEDSIRQQWLSEIPRITVFMWYLYFLSFPAAIIAGRMFLSNILQGKSIFQKSTLYWAIPGISGLLWSAGTGGRQALGILLFHFVIGAAFSLGWAKKIGFSISNKRAFKLTLITIITSILFSLFIGLTGLSRAKQQGSTASSFDDIWLLAPVGQLISYTGLSIATHQAYGEPVERDLSETGPVSLAGLQYFGLRYLTGWRPLTVDDTNPERALAASGLDLASGTRNVFYDFQADFGFSGAIIASLIMVIISHHLFLRTRFLAKSNLTAATPLIIMIMFWGYSHQFSLLMFNTFFWLFISCALWDIALFFIKRTNNRYL